MQIQLSKGEGATQWMVKYTLPGQLGTSEITIAFENALYDYLKLEEENFNEFLVHLASKADVSSEDRFLDLSLEDLLNTPIDLDTEAKDLYAKIMQGNYLTDAFALPILTAAPNISPSTLQNSFYYYASLDSNAFDNLMADAGDIDNPFLDLTLEQLLQTPIDTNTEAQDLFNLIANNNYMGDALANPLPSLNVTGLPGGFQSNTNSMLAMSNDDFNTYQQTLAQASAPELEPDFLDLSFEALLLAPVNLDTEAQDLYNQILASNYAGDALSGPIANTTLAAFPDGFIDSFETYANLSPSEFLQQLANLAGVDSEPNFLELSFEDLLLVPVNINVEAQMIADMWNTGSTQAVPNLISIMTMDGIETAFIENLNDLLILSDAEFDNTLAILASKSGVDSDPNFLELAFEDLFEIPVISSTFGVDELIVASGETLSETGTSAFDGLNSVLATALVESSGSTATVSSEEQSGEIASDAGSTTTVDSKPTTIAPPPSTPISMNGPPTALPDVFAATEGTLFVVNGLLDNDSDPEGEALVLTHINGQPVQVGSQVILGSGSVFTVTDTMVGAFTYNPLESVMQLFADESFAERFTYTVKAGSQTAIGEATINVAGKGSLIVSNDEDDIRGETLREAVVFANVNGNGLDTITLAPGNYDFIQAGNTEDDAKDGDLDITEDLIIQGSGPSSTIINAASLDRAIEILNGVTLTLQDVTITGGNALLNGGGGILNKGTLILDNVIITGNTTTTTGAGVATDSGTTTIRKTTIHGNTSNQSGGAIYGGGNSQVVVVNTTLSGNTATNTGGAIQIEDNTQLTVANATITENDAGLFGDGIFSQSTNVNSEILSSIVYGNDIAGSNEDVTVISSNINSTSTNIVGTIVGNYTPNTDLISVNPLLGPLQNNGGNTLTHAPDLSSPAKDAGSNSDGTGGTLTADQIGQAFVGSPDIGAVEIVAFNPNLIVTTELDIVDSFTVGSTAAETWADFVVNGDGFLSLREAVIITNIDDSIGDTIVLSDNSTYTLSIAGKGENGALTGDLDFLNTLSQITVQGGSNVIIDVNGIDRGIEAFTGTDLILNNITITGGVDSTGNGGGGIYTDGNITLNAVTLDNNQSFTKGGGLFVDTNGSATLNTAVVSNNNADMGGGIYTNNNLTLTDTTFDINTAALEGGALINANGTTDVTNAIFSNNTAGSFGGGIVNLDTMNLNNIAVYGNKSTTQGAGLYSDGTLEVQNASIYNNQATTDGGGIYNNDTTYLTNVTISGNTSATSGGGIYDSGGLFTANSTIANNTATTSGDGIFSNSGVGNIQSTIVYDNGSEDINALVGLNSGGNNVIQNISGGFTTVASDSAVDPLLGPLQDNGGTTPLPDGTFAPTHELQVGSSAINQGDNLDAKGNAITTDQRGAVFDGAPDSGAYEFSGFLPVNLTVTTALDKVDNYNAAGSVSDIFQDFVAGGDNLLSLREAIILANQYTSDAIITLQDNVTYILSIAEDGKTDGTTGDLDIANTAANVIINGGFNTTIDANGTDRIFDILTGSDVTINDVKLTGGDATTGGAIQATGSNLNLNDVEVANNKATDGGAIYSDGSIIILRDVTLAENTASDTGGAIHAQNSTQLFATNTTISTNTATNSGGAIQNESNSEFDLANVTITNNTAATGDGISSTSLNIDSTLVSSIIYGNGAEDINITGGNVTSLGSNVVGTINGSYTPGFADSNADPLLGPLQNNGGTTRTHSIDSVGSAFNQGIAVDAFGNILTLDQTGGTFNGKIDIGAYEVLPSPNLIVTTDQDIVDAYTLGQSAADTWQEFVTFGDGFLSLREAVLLINLDNGIGDTIILQDNNTYTLSLAGSGENQALTGDLDITNTAAAFTLQGGDNIVINANGLDRVFDILVGANFTINDVTITGGNATTGAAIQNVGKVDVNNSTISGNTATDRGGAIFNLGTTNITNVQIDSNKSANEGGAIFNTGTAIINNSTISGNESTTSSGGGIENTNGGFTSFINSTVSGNTAALDGGGINVSGGGSSTNIANSTIAFNNAANVGDGIAIDGVSSGNITSSIVYNNGTEDIFDTGATLTSAGNNLINNSTGFSQDVSDSNADPLLNPLANNGGITTLSDGTNVLTHQLTPGSAAVDAGNTSDGQGGVLTSDQIGSLFAGQADIGAVEFCVGVLNVTSSLDAISTYNPTDNLSQVLADLLVDGLTLREAIIFANLNICDTTINLQDNTTYDLILVGANEDGALTGDLDVTNTKITITINGGVNTELDGLAADRLFDTEANTNLTINNLIIDNGAGNAEGGAIHTQGILNLNDVAVSNSDATSKGGGIFNNGTLTLDNVTVTGNTAPLGAGIYTQSSNTLYATDSTITNNKGTDGAGVYIINDKNGFIDNTIIASNTATGVGGGVYVAGDSDFTIKNSYIHSNTANSGGGIELSKLNTATNGTVLTVQSSTIANNNATDGAGINVGDDSTLISVNNTIAQNTATSSGGGINVESNGRVSISNNTISENDATIGDGISLSTTDSTNFLTSNIIYNNDSTGSSQDINVTGIEIVSGAQNIVGSFTGNFTAAVSDLINTDPMLSMFAEYSGINALPDGNFRPTYLIDPFSPAHNAGNDNDGHGGTLLEGGRNFILFGQPDIGASEACYLRPDTGLDVVDTVKASSTTFDEIFRDYVDFGDGKLSLREAVNLLNVGSCNYTIELLDNFTYTLTQGELTISNVDQVVTIQGQSENSIIDGSNSSRIFNVSSNVELVIDSVVLQNARSSSGGAIISNDADLTITNSILRNNTATSNGGAITINGENAKFNLDSNIFENNTAYEGGAIRYNIRESGNTISNSSFINNAASYGTAIHALGSGVDQFNVKSFSVTNSSFVGNNAIGTHPFGLPQNVGNIVAHIAFLDIDNATFYDTNTSAMYIFGFGTDADMNHITVVNAHSAFTMDRTGISSASFSNSIFVDNDSTIDFADGVNPRAGSGGFNIFNEWRSANNGLSVSGTDTINPTIDLMFGPITNTIGTKPLLDGTYVHVLPTMAGSPAVDYSDSNGLTTDASGIPYFGNPDAGASEQLKPSLIVTTNLDILDTFTTGQTAVDTWHDFVTNGDLTLSLREAIILANIDNTLGNIITLLPGGQFNLSLNGIGENGALTGDLDITNTNNAIIIQGQSQNDITINANGIDRIFDIQNGAELILSDIILTNGVAATGGGIHNNGILSMNNSIITGNQATLGGAIFTENASTSTLNNSYIYNNQSLGDGGAILNQGDLLLDSTTLAMNSANASGGAISNLDGTVDIVNTTIGGNISQLEGAAITSIGGASTLGIANSTISENLSLTTTGGIYLDSSVGKNNITSSIVWGNSGNDIHVTNATLNSGTGNVVKVVNGFNLDVNDTTADPLLDNFTSNFGYLPKLPDGSYVPTYTLKAGSAAINFGNTSDGTGGNLTGDQLGIKVFDSPDSGATEYASGAANLVVTTNSDFVDSYDPNNTADDIWVQLVLFGDGFLSLREAVILVNTDNTAGNTIILDDNTTYTLASNLDLNATKHDIIIQGGNNTTIDGNGVDRIFNISNIDTNVTINDVTLQGGNADNGAAIINEGILTLNNVIVQNNTATQSAGGILNQSNATLNTNNSIFDNNISANFGGAIRNQSGTISINNSLFKNNKAADGGALRDEGGTTEITNSTLMNNIATSKGGAINTTAGTALSVINSTLSGNNATNDGGGISAQGATQLTIANSTITNNNAGNDIGDGLAIVSPAGGSTISSSIIYGNDINDIDESVISLTTANLTLNYDARIETDTTWTSTTSQPFDLPFGSTAVLDKNITSAFDINQAYSFHGAGGASTASFWTLPGDPTNDSASFELWVKPDNDSDTDIIFETGGNFDGVTIAYIGSTQEIVLDFNHQNASATLTAKIDISDFTQVTGVFTDGQGFELFINGSSAGKISNSFQDWAGGNPLGFGRGSDQVTYIGGNYEGDAAIFRFYERALTADEVGQNFAVLSGGGSQRVATDGSNIIGNVTGGFILNGDLTSNPLLDSLIDNGAASTLPDGTSLLTHATSAGSPAIDAGTTAGGITADQRGAVFVGAPDIGAFEFGGVPPVVLDLDGDGVELVAPKDGLALFNTDLTTTYLGWVLGDDAILAYDENGDGIVNNLNEIALAHYHEDATTDLEGLKLAFDSNNDNIFNAEDDKFNDFLLWQDLNQDGVSDANELSNLVDAGIVSIDLDADQAADVVAGNNIVGTTTFEKADGTTGDVADVVLSSYSIFSDNEEMSYDDALDTALEDYQIANMDLSLHHPAQDLSTAEVDEEETVVEVSFEDDLLDIQDHTDFA